MTHIQQDFEGSHLQKWEHDHGIFRYVRGGCEYVRCADFDRFNAQIDREKTAWKKQRIVDAQAEAYFGGNA